MTTGEAPPKAPIGHDVKEATVEDRILSLETELAYLKRTKGTP